MRKEHALACKTAVKPLDLAFRERGYEVCSWVEPSRSIVVLGMAAQCGRQGIMFDFIDLTSCPGEAAS